MSLLHQSKIIIKKIIPVKLLNLGILLFRQKLRPFSFEASLDIIEEEVTSMSLNINKCDKNILIGPSLSFYPPSFALDRLLSYTLRLRGMNIYSMYCDAIQSVECDFFGGDWAGGRKHKENCKLCMFRSKRLWKNNPIPPIKLSSHLNKEIILKINKKISRLKNDEWLTYSDDGMPLGLWAKDILTNNYLVGDYRLIENHKELGTAHLRNLMLLKESYINVFKTVQPNIVLCNDSYYGVWAILQELCKRQDIPFYSYWPTTKDRIAFAYGDAAMNLDFRKSWPAFSAQSMSVKQKQKIENWINGNRGLLIDTTVLEEHQNEYFEVNDIDPKKPTALLTSNVIWDLAALNKQIVFEDMIDWVVKTIEWFKSHNEYQLLIKPHPAEKNPSIPDTYETIERGLIERGINLPKNVFLFSLNAKITINDLLPYSKVLLVHTTSVGMEMAAKGIPVITSAKAPYRGFGFTYDPVSKKDYFDFLKNTLNDENEIEKTERIELAYKFIYFYQFHYYSKLGLFEAEWGKEPKINVKSAQELLPGKNIHLDYIIDSIINGQPIVSENRWPAES